MKTAPHPSRRSRQLFLAVSVAINVALAAIYFAGASANQDATSRTHVAEASAPASAGRLTSPPITSSSSEPGPETWALLNQGDVATRKARLLALGFSPSLARSILIAQLRTAYTPRMRELEMIYQRSPYFRPKALESEAFEEFRTLSREENRRIRELLGPDLDSAAAQNIRDALPGSSDEKVAQLTELVANYGQLRQEFTPNTRGTALTVDEREQMAALEKKMRTEMAALLTPQELEDYDLRTNPVASTLRTSLAGVDVTEAEFRALFRIQTSTNLGNNMVVYQGGVFSVGSNTPEDNLARAQATQQAQTQIAATLGPERYSAYQRANDYSYRQTSQLVARLALPPETANQLYLVQQDLQKRALAIQNDRNLANENRNGQLSTLAAEAQSKVTAALGASGYEAYKQYGGSWLNLLQPRPVAGTSGFIPVKK